MHAHAQTNTSVAICEATGTFYLCVGPRVWGTGDTVDEAQRNALKHRRWYDVQGPDGEPVWYTYELGDGTEWRIALNVYFAWPDGTPAPRLVEVRDGSGQLLPLDSVPPLSAD